MARAQWIEMLTLMSVALSGANCGGRAKEHTSGAAREAGAGGAGAAGAGGTSAGGTSAAGASAAGASTAGATGAAGSLGAAAAACALPADFVCTSTHAPSGCACDPTLVTGQKDCANTTQLKCVCAMGESQMDCVPENLYWNYDSVVCRCDTSAPRTPSDCPHTQQFACAGTQPFVEGCTCALDAPLSSADCVGEGLQYGCTSYNPDVGCACFQTMR